MNKIFIATSVDGFIADRNGSLEWLNENPSPSGSDGGYADFLKEIDAVVMGRATFETVLSFKIEWPYSKKVFVLSNTLQEIEPSLRDKIEIIHGDLKDIIEKLHLQGFKNLYIDGGKTIQSFLNQNLIHELVITRAPILLGGGSPLFGLIPHEVRLDHILTKTLDNGMVQSHYKVNGK